MGLFSTFQRRFQGVDLGFFGLDLENNSLALKRQALLFRFEIRSIDTGKNLPFFNGVAFLFVNLRDLTADSGG